MLLITIIKTIVTLQHYRVRYVLSSLCFGIALDEVFTVFGGFDCTVDVGTVFSLKHERLGGQKVRPKLVVSNVIYVYVSVCVCVCVIQ